MNNNGFDEQRKKENNYDYEIYSKSYTPNDDGYREEHSSYYNGRFQQRRNTGKKLLSIIAVILAISILCGIIMLGTAMVVKDYYKELSLSYNEGENVSGDNDHSGMSQNGDEKSDDWFYGLDAEIQIKPTEDTVKETLSGNIGDDDLSMADVVELVSSSVVEITTSETLKNGLVYSSGAGSGVIVDEKGIIITNNHVIADATQISVRLSNGNVYDAVPIATDVQTDLAVIKIEPRETLTLAVCGRSDSLRVGEEVLAIGNPLGVLGGTVTNGIVSALEREVNVDGETMVLLQHNAAVSPGNSGGALFNMKGQLIGIVNAKYSSDGAEGLGFAIPIDTVVEVCNDLIKYGYVKGRADHGISFTQQYSFQTGYFRYNVYVVESKYTDELMYGDLVVSINGKVPSNANEAYALLEGYEIGTTVEMVIYRSGKEIKVNIPISEYHP